MAVDLLTNLHHPSRFLQAFKADSNTPTSRMENNAQEMDNGLLNVDVSARHLSTP